MDDATLRAHAAIVRLIRLRDGINAGEDIHADEITEACEAAIAVLRKASGWSSEQIKAGTPYIEVMGG